VSAHQASYPIATMCRVLGVSTSGYYAWRNRKPSRRQQENTALLEQILILHAWSRGTFGAPRIHAELVENGVHVGHNRVTRRKRRCTTRRDPEAVAAADLVDRDFTSTAPDELWVADITYISTGEGFLYLAVVVDAYSRRVIGWAMAAHMKTQLVLDALEMAIRQRHPKGVIHHSDHGSQYTAVGFGRRCQKAGIRPSMGSVGDCYDNAMCESFFATLECELLDRHQFRTRAEARRAVFDFIEGWYNLHRLHSSLGYDTPVRYERRYAARIAAQGKEEIIQSEGQCGAPEEASESTLAGTAQMSSATLSAEPG
jgi:putative transposase